VAQDIHDGTFTPEEGEPVRLGLDRTAQGLEGSSTWLRDRRTFLADTFDTLFYWGQS